jgi:exonuclease III
LVIWTLNVAGGHTASKMNETHKHIMEYKPDIFILTDTKSDGHTIRTGWDWREYRIQESIGVLTGWHQCRHGGVLIGIRNTLTMIEGHTEVAGMEQRLAHVTIKISRGGKPTTVKVVGIYAPAAAMYGRQNEKLQVIESFFKNLSKFLMETKEKGEEWIVGGDYNVSLRPCERTGTSRDALKMHSERAAPYRELLANTTIGGYDWWTTRDDVVISRDRTRKDWGEGRDHIGNSIIDRFSSSNICEVVRIAPRNDLFVPGTDHLITEAKFYIKDMNTTNIDETHLRQWIERRVKLPPKDNKELLSEKFRCLVAQEVEVQGISPATISSHGDFDTLYEKTTEILTKACRTIFGNRSLTKVRVRKITTPQIIRKVREIRQMGRIVSALERGDAAVATLMAEYGQWAAPLMMETKIEWESRNHETEPSMANAARKVTKRKRKERMRLEWSAAEEIRNRATTRETKKVLLGASAKQLAGHTQIHIAAAAITVQADGATEPTMLTTEGDVKEATRNYFQGLYEKRNVPGEQQETPKPWMSAPSGRRLNGKSATFNMSWPPKITTDEIRYLLRRGKPAPSPGPDGWEKWCVRMLPDNALEIITQLVQYIIDKAYFSDKVKETIVITIYKKGDPTVLANYRGIMLSNLLMNLATAIEANYLQMWADAADLLPPHQVATKTGVQGRDATSLLAMITCWADRTNTPVYAMKKDQEKGFDYLSLQCFYDALAFYGLPPELEAFDRASQKKASCTIQTVFGPTDPLTIDDTNRQGDHRSPKRYTLGTGMCQWWIFDAVTGKAADLDTLITMKTTNGKQGCQHHPGDDTSTTVTEVTMTDDTVFLARNLKTLTLMHEMHEYFQHCYGAKTAFGREKTSGYFINLPDDQPLPATMNIRTVKQLTRIAEKWHITWVTTPIPVSKSPVFLKTTIDNDEAMFHELENTIASFQIPRAGKTLPIAAVRRLLNQLLMPRITQRLRLQPVSIKQAGTLDNSLATLINNYYGWQPRVKADVLQLDIEHNGFEFPSIVDANAAIAIKGLHRDLNHPCASIRQIAIVTFLDWTCQWNECMSPLLMTQDRQIPGDGYRWGKAMRWRSARSSDGRTATKGVPAAWRTAAEYLHKLGLSIVESDQCYVLEGRISARHALGKSGQLSSQLKGEYTIDRKRENIIARGTTNRGLPPPSARIRSQDLGPFRTKVAETTKRRFGNWARSEIAERLGQGELERLKLRADPTAGTFFENCGLKVGLVGRQRVLCFSSDGSGKMAGLMLEFPEDLTKTSLKKVHVQGVREEPQEESEESEEIDQRTGGHKESDLEEEKRNSRSVPINEKWTPLIEAIEGEKELGKSKAERRREMEKNIDSWAFGAGSGSPHGNEEELGKSEEKQASGIEMESSKENEEEGGKSKEGLVQSGAGKAPATGNGNTGQHTSRTFATDGSMYPASVKPGQHRTVSAACVTPQGEISAIVASNTGQVMHGELLGIIMALLQGRREGINNIEIFSDYMAAVRKLRDHNSIKRQIEAAMKGGLDRFVLGKNIEDSGLDSGAGRSWYRWIFQIWDEMELRGTGIELKHVKAHLTDKSEMGPEHRLNDKADKAAKTARDPISTSPNHCQWPTFTLDAFAIWDDKCGYIEADLYRLIKDRFKQDRKQRMHHSDYIMQLNTTPYEEGVHPEYMYRRATSDYSIKTQALVRGKALHTNRKMWLMFPHKYTPMCPNCPYAVEDEHHIFVDCPAYTAAREGASKELIEQIGKMRTEDSIKQSLVSIAAALFTDSPPWPSEQTRYYFGMIPPLDEIFKADQPQPEVPVVDESNATNAREESRSSIRKFLHAKAVRTAGYIWSIRMRNRHQRWKESQEETIPERRECEELEEWEESGEDEEECGFEGRDMMEEYELRDLGGQRSVGRARKRGIEEIRSGGEDEMENRTRVVRRKR